MKDAASLINQQAHWQLQANRTQATQLLGPQGDNPGAQENAARVLGALQRQGQTVDYPSLQRGMALQGVPLQVSSLNQAPRQGASPGMVQSAIEALQQRASMHWLQAPPAASATSAAAVSMKEKQWLQDSANARSPTVGERGAVQALLRSYQVPEHYAAAWADRVWEDMRKTGQAEVALLLRDGQASRSTQQGLIERLDSTQQYSRYLLTDTVAFLRVANQRLNPQMVFDRMALDANNQGVLTQTQLKEIELERDPERQTRLANLAFVTFRDQLAADWTRTQPSAQQPRYGDFAAYLQTPLASRLFAGVWNPAGERSTPQRLGYQASVLDFIGRIEQRLALGPGPAPASREMLLQARFEVEQQIKLIEERSGLHTALGDSGLSQRATELLTHLKSTLTSALTERR
jgi:hypothetical protein